MPVKPTRPRLALANLPTPLHHFAALDALVGCEVWVKRDDMTGSAETGNKVRKLQYLLADARARGADTVITCGGFQSNHCRATAVLARGIGMDCALLLRTPDGAPQPLAGNALLAALAGAELYTVNPAQYAAREATLEALAERLRGRGRRPYTIPEGGSNALGSLGYVDAMAELQAELRAGAAGGAPFDAVVVACGSGGTAAGCAVGAAQHGVAAEVWAFAVCDDAPTFERITTALTDATAAQLPGGGTPRPIRVFDAWRGPGYGVASAPQWHFMRRVAAATGLQLDPSYTGKALFGLAQRAPKPQRVCFVHTGGLPGLLADPEAAVGLRAAQPLGDV